MKFQDIIGTLPEKPGVYLMKDKKAKVIYVGKARSLKSRVSSYFQKAHHTPKEKVMVPRIYDVETIVTDSELEALILESNLIKRHRPKYNINLKDDKSYPYLKITVEEDFPRLVLTREMDNRGKFFGPYPGAGSVRETIRLLRKLFPLRVCKKRDPGKNKRPCLNFHINRCIAPCSGEISPDRYREMIDNIVMVLEGKADNLIKDLQEKMEKAAENMEFEKAADYRNQVTALKRIIENQKIISTRREDQDYIALYFRDDKEAVAQLFYVRGGKLVGKDSFPLIPGEGDSPRETLTGFIKQYYNQASMIPREILTSHEVEERSIIETWLKENKGSKVTVKTPKRGEKFQLMKMALNNARLELEKIEAEENYKGKNQQMTTGALKELADYLDMDELPERIECYDVSHLRGKETVASMVVFEEGQPKKEDYRRFKLNNVPGVDDYEAIGEVLERRLKKLNFNLDENREKSLVDSFESIPDLIIIDGGKGQLNRAIFEVESRGITGIPVASLAKEEEKVFLAGKKDPVALPKDSWAQYLLQRIRDEAHRFAVSYHRKRREKDTFTSELDKIKGIGPKRKKELLLNFGSVDELKNASLDDLINIPAMDKKSAENLYNYFNEKKSLH